MEIGLGKMPTHDPKAVPDRGLEPNAVEAPVGSLGDAHTRSDTGVGCGHYREKALDLIDVAHQIWSREHIASAHPDAHRFALAEVQLPLAPAWSQQDIALLYVAEWLPIV